MSLEFKKIEVNRIQEMLPFYAMRHNMTCDSVFLERGEQRASVQ